MAENQNTVLNDTSELKVRRDKLAALKEAGNDPYEITKYDVTHTSVNAIKEYAENEEALLAEGKELTVVALRNPYDIPLLPECACKIAAYDYGRPSFQALEDVFRGGTMTGVLPVKL